MDPKKIVTLCPACDACPAVEVYGETVRIGEPNNQVTLAKDEWNILGRGDPAGEADQGLRGQRLARRVSYLHQSDLHSAQSRIRSWGTLSLGTSST
jgi:hypothetical protein